MEGLGVAARCLKTLLSLTAAWWRTGRLPLRTRLAYPLELLKFGLDPKRRRVRYLGRPFEFDNPLTPLLLLGYPAEVGGHILDQLKDPIRHVLDVGGNLGQFTATLGALAPELESVDVLEPNPEILPLLRRNLASFPQVRIFEVGLGEPGTVPFYYTPGRSSIGSVYAENATYRPGSQVRRIDVRMVDEIAALTGRSDYDLVKIDVEGYEFEALTAGRFTTRSLFLELTGSVKQRSRPLSDLYAAVQARLGPYEVLYHGQLTAGSTTCNALFQTAAP